MVSAKHEKVLRVFNLIGKHQAYRLNRLLSPIYIVAQEQVVRVTGESCVFKQLYQV